MTRARVASLALLVAAATACAGGHHDAYRAAHPGWSASAFPNAQADLEETLAALDAPPGSTERTTLQAVRVLNVTGARWAEVPVAAIESGAYRSSALHSYLVLAQVACAATTADAWISNDDVAWYLLLDGQLAGYRHVTYDRTCRGAVQSARPRLDVEQQRCLREYAARSKGVDRLDLEQTCGAVARLRATAP